jgi:hypothetical protein
MLLVKVFEILAVVIGLVVLFTQVFAPLMYGEPVFPFFRKRKELETKLSEAVEEENNAKLEKEIEAHQKRTNKLKGKQ